MTLLLTAVSIALGVALLWTGRKHLRFTSYAATLLSILELAAFLLTAITLGGWGVAVLVLANLIAVLIWSVIHATRKQSLLVEASGQADVEVAELERIWDWMRREKAFSTLSPIVRAELIRDLCVRARTPDEIRAMAAPLAQLAVIFDSDLTSLVPRFDQLLRRAGKGAADAEGSPTRSFVAPSSRPHHSARCWMRCSPSTTPRSARRPERVRARWSRRRGHEGVRSHALRGSATAAATNAASRHHRIERTAL